MATQPALRFQAGSRLSERPFVNDGSAAGADGRGRRRRGSNVPRAVLRTIDQYAEKRSVAVFRGRSTLPLSTGRLGAAACVIFLQPVQASRGPTWRATWKLPGEVQHLTDILADLVQRASAGLAVAACLVTNRSVHDGAARQMSGQLAKAGARASCGPSDAGDVGCRLRPPVPTGRVRAVRWSDRTSCAAVRPPRP